MYWVNWDISACSSGLTKISKEYAAATHIPGPGTNAMFFSCDFLSNLGLIEYLGAVGRVACLNFKKGDGKALLLETIAHIHHGQ